MYCRIIDITTGKLVTRQTREFYSWEVVADAVASWFECQPSDVHCIDDEDGNEFITVDGAPVAKVEWVSNTKQQFAKLHDDTINALIVAE